jgi:hypothetical protein
MPYSRTLISPEGSDLCTTLLALGASNETHCVRFDAPASKYLLIAEHDSPRDEMITYYAESDPDRNLRDARFFYIEYNDPRLLVHLSPLVGLHPDIIVDAGPDIIEPLATWLESRTKGNHSGW